MTQRSWESLADIVLRYPVKRESHMYSKGPTMPETSVDPNDAVRDWHRQTIGLLAELGNVF